MTRPAKVLLVLFCVVLAAFFILPLVVVIPLSFTSQADLRFPPPGYSFQWYENFFTNQVWTRAAATSIKVAIPTTILATTLGTLAAFGIVRGRFPGRGLVNAFIMAPMIVPYVITAIAMFAVFTRFGLAGTLTGFILAHTALALPFVIVNVAAVLSTFDRRIELAAMNLGAGPIKTFFRVTLPLIMPGVLAGALFAFITSWDEIVVAIFLASPLVETLPVRMWNGVRTQIDPTIAAVSTVLIAVTSAVLISSAVTDKVRQRRLTT